MQVITDIYKTAKNNTLTPTQTYARTHPEKNKQNPTRSLDAHTQKKTSRTQPGVKFKSVNTSPGHQLVWMDTCTDTNLCGWTHARTIQTESSAL
jgi:hypothetical protein